MPASRFRTANFFKPSGGPITAIKPTTSASSLRTFERRSNRTPPNPSTFSLSRGSVTALQGLPNPETFRYPSFSEYAGGPTSRDHSQDGERGNSYRPDSPIHRK